MRKKVNNKVKSGFTVLELIAVIAIIALLSGILIPTFIYWADRGSIASDKALISQLNTCVNTGRIEGEKFNTMDEVIDYVDDHGFSIDKIKVGHGDVIWDTESREFLLVESYNDVEVPSQYFYIYDNIPSVQTYSIYLNNTELDLSNVEVKVGFDPGKNTSLGELTYSNDEGARSVVIRTNSSECNLTINAPEDTIHHYGECNDLTINTVSSSSYFECGKSYFATITQGRLILLSESDLKVILVNGNDVIVSMTNDVELPLIKRSADVTGTKLQFVNGVGDVIQQTAYTINGTTVTAKGTLPSEITDKIKIYLANASSEFSARMARKYTLRMGAEVEGDESNYYSSIPEAFAAHVADTTARTFYLLHDIKTTETIVISGKATKTHTLNLNKFTIEGVGCIPLSVEITNYYFTFSTGTIKGGRGYEAILYNTVTTSRYVTLTSISTFGGIKNTSPASSYFRVNGGTHRNWKHNGKVNVGVASSTTYFDFDPTDFLNLKRNKVVKSSGLWKVTRISQDTTKPIISSIDNFTYYSSIAEATEYDDFYSCSVRVLDDEYTEDIDVSITRTISIATGARSKPGSSVKTNHVNLSIKTSGAVTFSYGFFNVSSITCKTLTASTGGEVVVEGGTVTAIKTSTASSILTMLGGTCEGAITVTSTVACILNIEGGTYKGKLGLSSSSGKKHTVTVTGGTYTSKTIYDSFSKYIPKTGYHTVQDGSTYTVLPDEE